MGYSRQSSIVWCIDPFDNESYQIRSTANLLNQWRKKEGFKILPVSVISPYGMVDVPHLFPLTEERCKKILGAKTSPKITATRIKNVAPLEILFETMGSHKSIVKQVQNFAKSQNAELIATFTHGRRGLARLSLGSFTETLLASSDIPVLVMRHKMKFPKDIKKIFFPTDFSSASKKVLRRVIEWAKRFEAKVFIYHLVGTPFIVGEMDPRIIDKVVITNFEKAKKEGELLAEGIRKEGLDCEFFIENKPVRLADALVRNTKALHADIVVLTCSRGPLSQTVFGQSLREILTKNQSPMVVCHV